MVKADFFLHIQNRWGLITLKKVKWLIWDAYHLTEKSSGVVETIMVSDLPVYRRIAGICLFRELYFSNTFTIKLISKWFAFALVLISMKLFKVFFSRQHALTLFDLITKVLRCLLFFFSECYIHYHYKGLRSSAKLLRKGFKGLPRRSLLPAYERPVLKLMCTILAELDKFLDQRYPLPKLGSWLWDVRLSTGRCPEKL